ncbi:MAG TPA: NADH-quinone oxidoreductase subunit A [Acidimicrobiia bacterium]|nr:NADH-quinone oxidoreductase subunit A [Acidimicrobiia bacterium]
MSLSDYLPIGLMFLLVVAFGGVSVVATRWLAPQKPTPEKSEPYESGIVPIHEPVERFPVRFYVVAMLFVVFDIEIIFLFAWAVEFHDLGWYGMAAVGVFTLLLVETLVYVWKRGALDWSERSRTRYRRVVAPGGEEA